MYYKYIMWLKCAGSPAVDLYSLSRNPHFSSHNLPKGKALLTGLFLKGVQISTPQPFNATNVIVKRAQENENTVFSLPINRKKAYV